MAGHRPFSELIKDWSAERLQRVNEEASALVREMGLEGQQEPTPSAFATSPCEGTGKTSSVDVCDGEQGGELC